MNVRGKRLVPALLLAALVGCLLSGAALAIGGVSIDGTSPVTGTTGSSIDAKTFVLTISGNSFDAIPGNAELTSWMKNMPDGLRVTVDGSASTIHSVRITIEGTPTQTSGDDFDIVIPKGKLHDPLSADLKVTVGANARWNIQPSADSVIAVSLDGGSRYTPYADFSDGWNSAVGGGNTANTTVKLLQNWTADAGGFGTGVGFSNGGILIPAGKTVALDLCGKTVSANANVLGYAVTVNGALTLSDGGTGGSLTGATHGCVDVADSGSFAMSGGSITANAADANAGNVYVGGSFSVSGSARVTGNSKAGVACNVYLPDGKTVTVLSGLSQNARIGVTTQTPPTRVAPVAITNTTTTDASASFTSDDASYIVQDTRNHVVTLNVRQQINVAITPSDQFPVGNAGGNLTVNVGHGISDAELGARHIAQVKLDSAVLQAGSGADYTMTDGGSVIITLHKPYLNTLPVGAHTLSVAIGGGSYGGVTAQASLTVLPVATPGGVPQTGDDAQPRLWLGLALAAGAALSASLAQRRRRRDGRARRVRE